jgi:uncharacterized protein YggE
MLPFTISVTGCSDIYHKAERAIMSLTISDSASSQVQASASVTRTASQVRSILSEKASKDDAGVENPHAGIAHWKTRTLTTTSFDSRGTSSSKRNYRVTTGFEIKFRDFALLGSWIEKLGTIPNITIDKISWALTDVTRKRLETEGRKLCADDAMNKARDYAEAFGIDTRAVRVAELTDTNTSVNFETGHIGVSNSSGYSITKWEGGVTSTFENEEIRLRSIVTAKFVADLD